MRALQPCVGRSWHGCRQSLWLSSFAEGRGSAHKTFPFVSPLVRLEETCKSDLLSKTGAHLGDAGYLKVTFL